MEEGGRGWMIRRKNISEYSKESGIEKKREKEYEEHNQKID